MNLHQSHIAGQHQAMTVDQRPAPVTPAASTTAEAREADHRYERFIALITIITPFLAFGLAVGLLWGRGISLLDLGLCLVMYAFTMIGITMGYHRLFTHRSFKCVAAVRAALCIAGSMAAQGPVFLWTAYHRRHHSCSDAAGDPHSPHLGGVGLIGTIRGWWHSHVGWMLSHVPENYFKLVPDLIRDRLVVRLNRWYFVWVFAGLLLPAIAGGLISGTFFGFFSGFLWGGLVRVFLVHHSTWSINSVCHFWGSAPYQTDDESRNNLVCAALTFGEGWHNNHHAFPTSARHGLRWWQFDLIYIMIRFMEMFRLAWEVKVPDALQLAAKRHA
jgi:stearoyl-CoA desaturase (delta-9 desaturase)